jgi:hypothetical protein
MRKRLAPALVLAVIGCSGSNEPVWVENGRTPKSVFYSEPKLERPAKEGAVVAMRSLDSYTTDQRLASGETYRSLIYNGLYNCTERTWTVLAAEFYLEPMGKGKRVHVESVELDDALKSMKAYAPNALSHVRFIEACERGLK